MIANGAADAKRSSDLRVVRHRVRLAEFTALGDVLQIARVLGGDSRTKNITAFNAALWPPRWIPR